jgi:hypothetical protein
MRILKSLRGFVFGLAAGGAVSGYFGLPAILHAQRDTDVACAMVATDALASLRTGDMATAERHLEQELDLGVKMVKLQSVGSPIGYLIAGGLSSSQVQELSRIKYYRQAFPSTRPSHEATEQFLAAFPDYKIAPDPTCSSGFCRIAELKAKQ